jgi:ubiquinone biosynthesis protein
MRLGPRHLRRYRQIVGILADYGFGAFLAQVGISERLNLPRRLLRRKPAIVEELTLGQRIRLAIEELGPTFVKIGQLLSTRSDLLPPDILDELRKLQDQVPPGPWEPIRGVIENELGAAVNELFAFIDSVPYASASLGQVHLAIMPDGQEVVVKVLRPDIERLIEIDLEIIRDFAQTIQDRTNIGERYELGDLAEEFAIALQGELDFRREGRNADQFRENFKEEKRLHVPDVFWEYTTRRVMVQERITGIKIDEIEMLDAAGCDRKKVAAVAAELVLKEVLEDGYFHADPHPGNLLVLPDNTIGLLDFGTMGRLDTNDRIALARIVILVVQNDAAGIVDQLVRMGIADYRVNRRQLTRELRRVLLRYYGLPINEIPANEIIQYLEPIIYKHNLRVPSDYWLLIKTVMLLQGVGLSLDPEFDFFAATRPYVARLFRQIWLPSTWGPGVVRYFSDWSDFVSNLPRQSTNVLSQLERGQLGVEIEVRHLDDFERRLDRMTNRIVYGVVLSAIVVGLAILLPSLDLTWPFNIITWIAIGVFVLALILSIQLLWSIFRSRRGRRR